jgi:hypothetical protein
MVSKAQMILRPADFDFYVNQIWPPQEQEISSPLFTIITVANNWREVVVSTAVSNPCRRQKEF